MQIPVFLYIKEEFEGVYISWNCFPDEILKLKFNKLVGLDILSQSFYSKGGRFSRFKKCSI